MHHTDRHPPAGLSATAWLAVLSGLVGLVTRALAHTPEASLRFSERERLRRLLARLAQSIAGTEQFLPPARRKAQPPQH